MAVKSVPPLLELLAAFAGPEACSSRQGSDETQIGVRDRGSGSCGEGCEGGRVLFVLRVRWAPEPLSWPSKRNLFEKNTRTEKPSFQRIDLKHPTFT